MGSWLGVWKKQKAGRVDTLMACLACVTSPPETGKKAYGALNGKASYFPALPAPSSHSLRTFCKSPQLPL